MAPPRGWAHLWVALLTSSAHICRISFSKFGSAWSPPLSPSDLQANKAALKDNGWPVVLREREGSGHRVALPHDVWSRPGRAESMRVDVHNDEGRMKQRSSSFFKPSCTVIVRTSSAGGTDRISPGFTQESCNVPGRSLWTDRVWMFYHILYVCSTVGGVLTPQRLWPSPYSTECIRTYAATRRCLSGECSRSACKPPWQRDVFSPEAKTDDCYSAGERNNHLLLYV